jgi:PAS domain-containing protein
MAGSGRRIAPPAPAARAGRGGGGLRAGVRPAGAGRRAGRRRHVPLRHPDHPRRARVRAGGGRPPQGLCAVALFAIWDATSDEYVSVVAYLTRTVSFVVVGWLTGRRADRLRATGEQTATAARHFELARDLLCTSNLDGHLVELNGAWEETLGWSREELTAKPFVSSSTPTTASAPRGRQRRCAPASGPSASSTAT